MDKFTQSSMCPGSGGPLVAIINGQPIYAWSGEVVTLTWTGTEEQLKKALNQRG